MGARRLRSADVIVVGGGAVGIATALELARAGAKVTVLEAGPEVGSGCSGGNAGLICPSHAAPLATRAALADGLRFLLTPDGPLRLRARPTFLPWLARFVVACTPGRERASTDLLRSLARESLILHAQLGRDFNTGVERTGTLNIYETERLFERGKHEAAEHARFAMRVEFLSSREATELEPALLGPLAGAIHYPDELSGDPLEFVLATCRAATAAGANVRTRVEVLGFETRGSRINHVETTAGRFAAGAVVLAAGVWSKALVRDLHLPLPVEGGRGYHVDFSGSVADPRMPLFLQEARVVATPLPGKLRLAGMFELTGLDSPVDVRRVRAIRQAGATRVGGLASRSVADVWSGFRPCAPDGLPIVGRPTQFENLVIATGHSMLGFTLAPITGKLVRQLVLDGPPSADIHLLHPDRFRGLGRSGMPTARGKGLSRLGVGEAGGVGFLEGDQAAGELE